jgi:4-amino-4-deoxy-L-arabinose transferase-like glycosyltransferase
VLAGVLAGLAGLTHLYGACWLPALLLALLAGRGRAALRCPAPYLLLAGFALAWLPWLLYVASDVRDYAGQMRIVSERFALLDPAFYRQNFERELDRYALYDLVGRWGLPRPARAGAWVGIVGVPLGLALALHQGRRRRDAPIVAVAVALVTHVLLFALLLQPKTYAYLVALWPLVALLVAWLGVRLWDAWRAMLPRAALLLLAAAVLAEGASQMRAARVAPATSYEALGERIAAAIPPGARVLGIHTHWLALRQFPYRSWAVPALLANGRYNREEAPSFDAALERVAPDVVLIDPEMATFLNALASPDHPQHAWLAQYESFMRRHNALLVATIEDATYGRILVYRLVR